MFVLVWINGCHDKLISVSLHTEGNLSEPKIIIKSQVRMFSLLIGQMCLGREREHKHRKKVLKKLRSAQIPRRQCTCLLVRVGPCWFHSSTSQHAKRSWLREPFSSNLKPCSWQMEATSRFHHKHTKTTSSKGSLCSYFGLRTFAVFRSAQTDWTTEENQPEFLSARLNYTAVWKHC